jgi:hypothetical protein
LVAAACSSRALGFLLSRLNRKLSIEELGDGLRAIGGAVEDSLGRHRLNLSTLGAASPHLCRGGAHVGVDQLADPAVNKLREAIQDELVALVDEWRENAY